MRLSLIILTLVLFSCEERYGLYVDDRLEIAVDDFYKEAESRGIIYPKNVTVEIKKLHGLIGQYNRDTNTVTMNADWILPKLDGDSLNYNGVKLAVFHELGHWAGKRHRGGRSIMNTNPDFGGCKCGDFVGTMQLYNKYPEHRKEILDEFFNH